jgi:copper(I)-binding protein
MTGGASRAPVRLRQAIACALVAFAASAHADVALQNAWMRPAPAGAQAARVYVDISSDRTLDLVAARTPIAKRVAIVRVGVVGDESTEKVVGSFAVLGGTTTRLAYRGDHLRLLDITRDVGNGDPAPLTLVFKDAGGKTVEASTQVTVRGLLLPQQVTPAIQDAPHAPPVKPR